MKIYKKNNVYEEAYLRISRLFEEFTNVVVGISGGKDSSVVYDIAYRIAKKKKRLPLNVMWLDQEAEWQGTVDTVTKIMNDPNVNPFWLQIPMELTNNANTTDRYSFAWHKDNSEDWIHPQVDISIKDNVYGTSRFHDIFRAFMKYHFPNEKSCYVAGMRTEESPMRLLALTQNLTYKDITWGKTLDKNLGHYTFYPIYDWSYTDVWKYLHSNNVEYNPVYDAMYQQGVSIRDMRISNLHHETAIQNLMLVQEIEPKTWNRISNRIKGANTIKHIRGNSFKCPKKLPYMFSSWREYAYFLAEKIAGESEYYDKLISTIQKYEKIYDGDNIKDMFYKKVIDTVLASDFDFTKLSNWTTQGAGFSYKRFKQGKYLRQMLADRACFTDKELQILLEGIKNNEK
jgi:predicted phosphoadenosine phosphosulfate sulfurtransferase